MFRVTLVAGDWLAIEIDSVEAASEDISNSLDDGCPTLIVESVEAAEAALDQDVELVGDDG